MKIPLELPGPALAMRKAPSTLQNRAPNNSPTLPAPEHQPSLRLCARCKTSCLELLRAGSTRSPPKKHPPDGDAPIIHHPSHLATHGQGLNTAEHKQIEQSSSRTLLPDPLGSSRSAESLTALPARLAGPSRARRGSTPETQRPAASAAGLTPGAWQQRHSEPGRG